VPPRSTSLWLILAGLILLLSGFACWRLGFDIPLHRALRMSGALPWTPRVIRLSALGGLAIVGPIGLAGVALLAARRRMGEAIWLFATLASGRLLVEAIKLTVERPRPPIIDRLELVKSWSFPSSHSAGSMMTCVALALLFGRSPISLTVALLCTGIIGWTRVALGVHWPSDVLAGWGLGLAWLGLALPLRPRT
jgi:membrane-associated phospholipid phosphatase